MATVTHQTETKKISKSMGLNGIHLKWKVSFQEKKMREPFEICLLTSTANPSNSTETELWPPYIFFFIFFGYNHSLQLKFIETHAFTFLSLFFELQHCDQGLWNISANVDNYIWLFITHFFTNSNLVSLIFRLNMWCTTMELRTVFASELVLVPMF
jgi:hypothetical protein